MRATFLTLIFLKVPKVIGRFHFHFKSKLGVKLLGPSLGDIYSALCEVNDLGISNQIVISLPQETVIKKDWLGKEIGTEVRAANGMNFYCYGGNKDDEGNISIYVLNLGTTDRDTHYSFNDRGICRGQEKLGLGK